MCVTSLQAYFFNFKEKGLTIGQVLSCEKYKCMHMQIKMMYMYTKEIKKNVHVYNWMYMYMKYEVFKSQRSRTFSYRITKKLAVENFILHIILHRMLHITCYIRHAACIHQRLQIVQYKWHIILQIVQYMWHTKLHPTYYWLYIYILQLLTAYLTSHLVQIFSTWHITSYLLHLYVYTCKCDIYIYIYYILI